MTEVRGRKTEDRGSRQVGTSLLRLRSGQVRSAKDGGSRLPRPDVSGLAMTQEKEKLEVKT